MTSARSSHVSLVQSQTSITEQSDNDTVEDAKDDGISINEGTDEPNEMKGGQIEDIQNRSKTVNVITDDTDGVLLDADREVRVKLYMGQVFMGWLWFIPIFHMSPPTSATGTSDAQMSPPSTVGQEIPQTQIQKRLVFTRDDLDFPIGVGSAIVDVAITLEWVVPQ